MVLILLGQLPHMHNGICVFNICDEKAQALKRPSTTKSTTACRCNVEWFLFPSGGVTSCLESGNSCPTGDDTTYTVGTGDAALDVGAEYAIRVSFPRHSAAIPKCGLFIPDTVFKQRWS